MRSCSNNTFGVMMASPFTTVKGDEFTRLTPAGIIRCLQVQDPALGDTPNHIARRFLLEQCKDLGHDDTIIHHRPSTCASAASACGSQKVIAMSRYRAMA